MIWNPTEWLDPEPYEYHCDGSPFRVRMGLFGDPRGTRWIIQRVTHGRVAAARDLHGRIRNFRTAKGAMRAADRLEFARQYRRSHLRIV
jgi:hypothetical protein